MVKCNKEFNDYVSEISWKFYSELDPLLNMNGEFDDSAHNIFRRLEKEDHWEKYGKDYFEMVQAIKYYLEIEREVMLYEELEFG